MKPREKEQESNCVELRSETIKEDDGKGLYAKGCPLGLRMPCRKTYDTRHGGGLYVCGRLCDTEYTGPGRNIIVCNKGV